MLHWLWSSPRQEHYCQLPPWHTHSCPTHKKRIIVRAGAESHVLGLQSTVTCTAIITHSTVQYSTVQPSSHGKTQVLVTWKAEGGNLSGRTKSHDCQHLNFFENVQLLVLPFLQRIMNKSADMRIYHWKIITFSFQSLSLFWVESLALNCSCNSGIGCI